MRENTSLPNVNPSSKDKALAAPPQLQRLRVWGRKNTILTKLLEQEKVKAEGVKDELIQRGSALLGEFTSGGDCSLREVVSYVRRTMRRWR